jgi:hypothetical protein
MKFHGTKAKNEVLFIDIKSKPQSEGKTNILKHHSYLLSLMNSNLWFHMRKIKHDVSRSKKNNHKQIEDQNRMDLKSLPLRRRLSHQY